MITPACYNPPMDAKDSPVQVRDSQTWAEALAFIEYSTEKLGKILRRAVIVSYLGFVATLMITLDYPWIYKLLGLLALILIRFIPWPKAKTTAEDEQKEDLFNRIKASGLAKRLKSGSLHNDQIREHTHAMARWFVPPLKVADKVGLLRRLARHLEWYLVPPGPLYKEAGWLAVLAVGVVVLVITWFVTGDPVSILPSSWQALPFILFALVFFSHLIFDFQRSRIIAIGNYLREELGESEFLPTRKEINEALVKSLDGELHRDYNMDLIINQCDKVLDHYKHLPSMIAFMIMPAIMIFGVNQIGFASNETIKNVILFGSILAVVGLVGLLDKVLTRKSAALQEKYCERLTSANLAARIVIGEATKAKLEAHIPRGLRMAADGLALVKLPTGEGAEVSADIICVALNLDWFLEHPKPLIRPIWIAVPVLFIAGAVFAVAKVFSANLAGSIPTWAWALLGTAGLACWITLLQDAVKMRAGSLALIEHLREGRS